MPDSNLVPDPQGSPKPKPKPDRLENPHENRNAAYYDNNDPEGLVAYLEAELSKDLGSRMLQQELVSALLRVPNPQHQVEKARSILEPLYKKDPSDPWVQRAILDLLLIQGLPWTAFPWKFPPKVYDLDRGLVDMCADLLRAEGGFIDLYRLFDVLPPEADGFTFFAVDELARALSQDPRFAVELDEGMTVFLIERRSSENLEEGDHA